LIAWPALVGLLFLLFFGGNLFKLGQRWINDPSYSHGFLVPILSLWLAFRAYRKIGPPALSNIRLGTLAIISGATLHLILTVINNPVLDFVAVALVLWGIAVTIGGVKWASGLLFPIGFLFFMFPLPATWTNFAGLWLQDWVARISAVVIDPFVVCYRRGTSLYLAGVKEPLVVAAECSGLRQIVAFVALGVLVGGLSQKSISFRILLAASAIPVAIVANVCRILLMAAGSRWFGTHWMDSWMHDAPAMLTLPLGLLLFLLVGWGLNRLTAGPRPKGDEGSLPRSESRGSGNLGLRVAVAFLVSGLLAEGGLAWYLRVGQAPEYPELHAPFASLPLELTAFSRADEKNHGLIWRGRDVPNLDEFRAKLPYISDDLLYRHYVAEKGRPTVTLYMVYSRQGEDRRHHPEICIRDASGATEDFGARRQMVLDSRGERTVMRFRFRTGIGQYTTVYYWHYSLESQPRSGQTTLRRIYQQQNHPVPSITVQISLVGDEKDVETVESGFLAAVDSALCRTQLPATARIGCQRLPIALVRD
jgi:exosortase